MPRDKPLLLCVAIVPPAVALAARPSALLLDNVLDTSDGRLFCARAARMPRLLPGRSRMASSSAMEYWRWARSAVYDAAIVWFTSEWYKRVLERVPVNARLLDVGIGACSRRPVGVMTAAAHAGHRRFFVIILARRHGDRSSQEQVSS